MNCFGTVPLDQREMEREADIDAHLITTKTSIADGEAASEAWLRRKKRTRSHEAPPETVFAFTDGSPTVPQRSSSSGLFSSRDQSVALCNRIVHWMFTHQLGGRHNAALADRDTSEKEDRDVAIQLSVERVRCTAPALTKVISHIARCVETPAGLELVQSETRLEDVPPEITGYRRSLALCWDEIVLVGGLCDVDVPDARRHAMRTVVQGLHGIRPVRRTGQAAEVANSASVSKPAETETTALLQLLHSDDEET